MIDIFQLKEKGILKYLKTHAKAVDGLLDATYPIGAVYLSISSVSPATLLGGTWERIANGRTLVAVNESDDALKSAGLTGGSTNPLSEHSHNTKLTTYRVTSGTGSGSANNLGRATDVGDKMDGLFGFLESQGSNTNHANWQPFFTVYMWKRIA